MTIAARPATGARAKRALCARGRIDALCDDGSFQEIETRRRARPGDYASKEPVDGDGVVVGWGMVRGRPTAVMAHDFGYAGGSIGAAFAQKVTRIQRLAMERRIPIVYLNDSGGARIHEGIDALNGCGEIMALNVRARRVIPQVSVIMGPCAGAAAYSPALTDWTIMVGGLGQMFLTGPEVVRAATGEQIDPEELGGATLHTKESGVAHFETPTEEDALGLVRQLLGYFPQTAGGELPERLPASPLPARIDALPSVVPASARATYDMRDVIGGIVDASVMLEVMAQTAPSLLTGFARIEGSPVGIVANQPRRRGGILDAATAVKGARFVSFCGRFGIPVVTLVDVPGFMPGSAEEKRAVITHGASLLAAYVEADTPKLTVIVRKAYGGAYIALGSRALGADMSWAWPGAEIAVMGPEAAVGLLHRRELAAAGDATAARAALADDYRARITTPSHAAGLGLIDDIIVPQETRTRLARALQLFS
jgi:acetyl-CoA/propionyl-CoA carboxylase carboxyl transferase subunit